MLAVGAKGNLLENLPPELILTENVALPYFLCASILVFSESFPLFSPSLVGLPSRTSFHLLCSGR